MDKFHFKKVMNEAKKAERVLINQIKHKLQFGGLAVREEFIAKDLLKRGIIGQRYVSLQYEHLIPVAQTAA